MLRSAFAREEAAVRAALAALDDADAPAAAAIEARLAPLLATPRGRFLCLEGGGVGRLLAQLKAAAEEGEEARSRPSCILPWCRLLRRCCADEESAVALGLLGGHGLVKRLMAWEVEAAGSDMPEEEGEMDAAEAVVECAAEIASRCSLVRGGFPLRTLALCEVSTREALQLPVRMAFDAADGPDNDNDTSGGGLVALLTAIGDRRMGGQADTGYVNWPAATILARWLALHPRAVAGKAVMEVGAGLGLCGLVAARWAREVLLTDYNLACLERLQRHVELNRDGGAGGDGDGGGGGCMQEKVVPALAREDGVKVRWLDWDRIETLLPPVAAPGSGGVGDVGGGKEALEGEGSAAWRWRVGAPVEEGEEEEDGPGGSGSSNSSGTTSSSNSGGSSNSAFGRPAWGTGLLDVIIGSDVICDASCARGVAGLIAATLKPAGEGGMAYVTAPFPAHRYGVDCFPAELKAHGLAFQQAEVTDSRLLAGIPEAAYMRFHLYTITKPDASEAVPRE